MGQEHLHSQTDTEQRLSRGNIVPQSRNQFQPLQIFHAGPKSSNTRQYNPWRSQNLFSVTRDHDLGTQIFKGPSNVKQITNTTINNDDFRRHEAPLQKFPHLSLLVWLPESIPAVLERHNCLHIPFSKNRYFQNRFALPSADVVR